MVALPPAALAALAIGSAIFEAVGQISQGRDQARALEFNARQRDQDARQATLSAAEEERRIRRDNALRIGDFAAQRGASGVALEGSPLEVIADASAEGELRALDARYGGLMAARTAQQEAAFMRMQAKSTRRNALFGAAGTLIGGGLKAGSTLMGSGTGGATRFTQAQLQRRTVPGVLGSFREFS